MMRSSTPCETYEVNPVLERAMDRILILHADHEQNASTSTVRTRAFKRRQPARLHCRRDRPVGTWRTAARQRSRAENAGRNQPC